MPADLPGIRRRAESVFTPAAALRVDVETLLAEVDRLTTERDSLGGVAQARWDELDEARREIDRLTTDLATERAAVVAYLRRDPGQWWGEDAESVICGTADDIEAGLHREETPND